MKIKSITSIPRERQYDITTGTGNFCVPSTESNLVVHNSPAVFAGIDPNDGQFFVAKKGIFNKDPKVYKSIADVKADTSGDLATKLIESFKHLSKLNIKGVLQGDLMFTKSDIKVERIKGQKYVTFQPNTIVYAVPYDSDLAKQIRRAKIGIVFHTKYTGKDFPDMKADFNVDSSSLTSTPDVWFQDAKLRDISGQATFTKKDTDDITKILSEAGKIFNKIAASTIKEIGNTPKLAQTIETYNNSLVRKAQSPPESRKHVKGLIKYVEARFDKERDKLKSDAGKEKSDARRDEFMAFFSESNKKNLELLFDLQKKIVEAKSMVIKKIDMMKKMDTFVRTKDGFRVTGQEGFVAIDKINSSAFKLVDRLEFSSNNFSPDVLKGWS